MVCDGAFTNGNTETICQRCQNHGETGIDANRLIVYGRPVNGYHLLAAFSLEIPPEIWCPWETTPHQTLEIAEGSRVFSLPEEKVQSALAGLKTSRERFQFSNALQETEQA